MKRLLLSAALVSAFAFATAAMAQDRSSSDKPGDSQSKSMQSASSIHGTITSVDNSGKSFTVKDDSGKETTVFWDSSTKVSGDLKVGSMVTVQSSQSSGKTMASSVEVKSAQKPY